MRVFCRLACIVCASFLLWCIGLSPAIAGDSEVPAPEEPSIAAASREAELAIAGFQMPESWSATVFAAEPMMANPVAFFIDGNGDLFVCESYRQSAGVEDNRSHLYWVDDDLAATTVKDRRAFILKHHEHDIRHFTRYGEQLRLLRDTDRDGRADRSTVFASGFNDIVSGSAAGVLRRGDDVYFACVPDLWLLRDQDDDGVADAQEKLFHGFGVHCAYKGHDLHGLTVGPDGKLYFSVGDRGYHVQTPEGLVADSDSGAVFRCNWDGSGLEVIHAGLRNPQEMAFDDYGNLFVADNDSDSYDESRWIPVVDGGDSGWRMGFQYLTDRGPFHRENLWLPYHKEQPAYLAPTIANVGAGPSGLAYYPGTGLGEHFQGRFLLCDFRGGAVNSGIDSFRVRPRGAFFELIDRERTLQGVLATDVDFGPDGAVYVSDWVHGWNGEGKGRIYRFADTGQSQLPVVEQVRLRLRDGAAGLPNDKLVESLGHQDRRLRLQSQFALVDRQALGVLEDVALKDSRQLARIHALWGLVQLANSGGTDSKDKGSSAEGKAPDSSAVRGVVERVTQRLLGDEDAEMRAQAARAVGEAKLSPLAEKLQPLIEDNSLRVRYHAVMSLSLVGSDDVLPGVIHLLEANADSDPMIRHAGIMALTRLADEATLAGAMKHDSGSVRLATAVALRRRGDPQVAYLLADAEPHVIDEAARAIYDVPIEGPQRTALDRLAGLLAPEDDFKRNNATLLRALGANYRLGGADCAKRIAAFAAHTESPSHLRVEALKMLAVWAKPSGRDWLLSMWRPIDARSAEPAALALTPHLADVLAATGPVRSEAARTAAALRLPEAVPVLEKLVRDTGLDGQLRSDSLATLAEYEEESLAGLLLELLEDDDSLVRTTARRIQARVAPAVAVKSLSSGIEAADLRERQAAWETLATIESPAAAELIAEGLRRLAEGTIPADTRLDVLLAAEQRSAQPIAERLEAYRDQRDDNDPLAKYRETLVGGRAEAGREIFYQRRDVSCLRCHRVDNRGGAIGPDLSGIGTEKTREYLLESLVLPNRTIAKGFEPVVIVTEDGVIHSGLVESEDEQQVRLITAQGERIEIDSSTIEERGEGQSAMPTDVVQKLTLRELRDLIEYLATLQAEKKK